MFFVVNFNSLTYLGPLFYFNSNYTFVSFASYIIIFAIGLAVEELKMEPTNKQLLHFAQNMGFYDFISFAKDIGVPDSITQNYTSLYGKEPVHIIFMILYYWKSNSAYPTFTDLLHGLIRKDMTSELQHILCHVSAFYFCIFFFFCSVLILSLS